jgi:hypothetical protein
VLGQSAKSAAMFDALASMASVFVLGMIGIVVLAYLRRRWGRRAPLESIGFSVAQLRSLRDQGEISIEEYKKLRDKAVCDNDG